MLSPRLIAIALLSLVGIGLIYFTVAKIIADRKKSERVSEYKHIGPAAASPLNPSETTGDYLGYGIGIHGSDVKFAKAFDELKPRFVRMEFGPQWELLDEKIPSAKLVDDYVQYLQRNYNGDFPNRLQEARRSHQFLNARGIQIIQVHFQLPSQWCSEYWPHQLRSKHIEDLARFHTAHLKFLSENGIHVDFMELCNEPHGSWNGYISHKDYARLLERCDALFEEHGFGNVKILGPGLAYLELYKLQQPYFDAIKEVGTEHLDGWSTHIWDEVEFNHSRTQYTYGVWEPFLKRIAELDPERKKPVFVTEYASDIVKFGDRQWASPRDRVTDTVVDQWPHAVRVVANSITHLNRGANGLVVYRLSDTHWHKTGWGFIIPTTGSNFKTKPIYHALVQHSGDPSPQEQNSSPLLVCP